MFLNDPLHDVEPESGSLTVLRREERIEDSTPDIGRDPRTIVDDADNELLTFRRSCDVDTPGRPHGVQRIVDKIRPDLIQLSGKAP